jgi:hypothetical protein
MAKVDEDHLQRVGDAPLVVYHKDSATRHRQTSFRSAGSVTLIVVPSLSRLSKLMAPPCCSMIFLA